MDVKTAQSPTHLSLFSGIGGLDIAAEAAGFVTVGQCEWADYPTMVLEKHWPNVPRWRDIRTLTKESFYARAGIRTVDVISGGFPCQPFSLSGRRRGKNDDRYLWPEMLRVIQELRPSWVVGENVAGIVSLALDQVLSDLENQGYETRAFIIPACGVDAPHRRDRVAIVAYAQRTERGACQSIGDEPDREDAGREKTASRFRTSGTDGGAGTMAHTDPAGPQGSQQHGAFMQGGYEEPQRSTSKRSQTGSHSKSAERIWCRTAPWRWWTEPGRGGWWPTEPIVGRVANGVPNRVDRLKCLGNAVVPAQFYPIFQAIFSISFSGKEETNP